MEYVHYLEQNNCATLSPPPLSLLPLHAAPEKKREMLNVYLVALFRACAK